MLFFFYFGTTAPQRTMASSLTRFPDHTRRTTVGRTPLYEWSARRRDLYLTTHNTHDRETSMSPVGFEPTVAAGERPQNSALDRAVCASTTWIYNCNFSKAVIFWQPRLYSFASLPRCRKYNHIMIRIISENVSDVDSGLCIECSPLLKSKFSQIHSSKIKRLFRTTTLEEKYGGIRSDSRAQVCNFFLNFPLTPVLQPHIFLSF